MQASLISVFDIFKIGVGPSSSHTVGPMVAARRFRRSLAAAIPSGECHLRVELFGSLAATGRGHRTDDAICAGLLGLDSAESPMEEIWRAAAGIQEQGGFDIEGLRVGFDPGRDILWSKSPPSGMRLAHPNTLCFAADQNGIPRLVVTARSVGGGFVEYDDVEAPSHPPAETVPYPFDSATELVGVCAIHGINPVKVALANESARGFTEEQIRARLTEIWEVMNVSMDEGLSTEGMLPGGLQVERRAPRLYRQSRSDRLPLERHADLRTSAFAMAVAEQNACGGRVVTAPTNGSAGVLPAVLREVCYERDLGITEIQNGLLIAGVMAAIVKCGASISGAEVGCQGEIGVSAAMAAAAATGMLGGHVRQMEDAAEIAIEHHLGLTCDPVRGLVQIPCIERNAMGAIKALNAAAMALASDGTHVVSLDRALRVMKQTGMDLQDKYRETATGGLAVG
ncbi:MAG TPA: L-serine ammonia-lyase [Phycisphaerae bacterium]|nr:L-serine ammonia-lyase [Phycisphaerae bacterium]HRY66912.1 L-serine ammonia-lyase [Phycisphaerae bacterium]HSA27860.1 L-serine ammonia-lyase [Phycisphaerae bacterium]